MKIEFTSKVFPFDVLHHIKLELLCFFFYILVQACLSVDINLGQFLIFLIFSRYSPKLNAWCRQEKVTEDDFSSAINSRSAPLLNV